MRRLPCIFTNLQADLAKLYESKDCSPLKTVPSVHSLVRCHGLPRQFRVGFAERGFAGSAAPALDSALTKVPETLACRVVTTGAGHDFSPLDFVREKSQTIFGSGVRLTLRSGLAPQPVSQEAGR